MKNITKERSHSKAKSWTHTHAHAKSHTMPHAKSHAMPKAVGRMEVRVSWILSSDEF